MIQRFDIDNGFHFATLIAAITVTVIAVALAVGWWWETVECDRVGRETGRATSWEIVGGCYIDTDQGMIPVDRWWVER